MNTRRYPRTMQQAFGPYTDNTLHPMRDRSPVRRADIALYIIAVLAVVVIGVTL